MTPAEFLASFPTPQAAYEKTQENFRAGLLGPSCPERLPRDLLSGKVAPWTVLARTHLRTYWHSWHLRKNISVTLWRTPNGCR